MRLFLFGGGACLTASYFLLGAGPPQPGCCSHAHNQPTSKLPKTFLLALSERETGSLWPGWVVDGFFSQRVIAYL